MTIGVLDGVHRGHQALIAALDDSMIRTVCTFDPHPIEVLRPGFHPRLITTIEERVDRLGAHGVEQVGILDLTHIKELSPVEFVEDVLVRRLSLGHLVVGRDFRFGKDRSGDVDLLAELGPFYGFRLDVIDLVSDEGGAVSSSRIRAMIEGGEAARAAEALGAPYRVTGRVIEGDKRGREIGFPTANMVPPERKVIPATGIYAAWSHLGDERHPSAINVGVRPTFGEGELLIEAYLLDYEGDLYDRELTVEFVEFLRPESKFDSVRALVAQMHDDVVRARGVLETA